MVFEVVGQEPTCPGPPLENVDPLTTRAFHAFGRLLRLHRQAMLKTLDEQGVHHGDAFCLRLLAKKEGVSQHEMAEILHISRPQMTKILQSAEKSGLIARHADENDQRRTLVFLTPEGRDEERRFRSFLDGYINQSIGALPEADRSELERLFNDIAGNIEEILRADREVER
jgi:MarR family transcriptional regulator, organic hydroperoxide resistance regulator